MVCCGVVILAICAGIKFGPLVAFTVIGIGMVIIGLLDDII